MRHSLALLPATLIYLAPPPDGSDANMGTTPTQAVATLQRALDLASAGPQGTEAQVIVEPKVFPPGNASISRFIDAPIRILGQVWPGSDPAAKPTFSCSSGQSVVLEVGRTGTPALYTGVSVEGAVITGCPNGVEFRGNLGDPRNFIWGNSLVDVDFRDIGGTGDGGYEAVGVFNNWGFKAYNLTFKNIKNPVNPWSMHAFYVGHHSRDVWIGHETYTGISGATIALRNDVENTLIYDQTFGADLSSPKIIDWYCRSSDEPCPALDGSTTSECPSWGTYVESAKGLSPSDVEVYDGNTGTVPYDQYVRLGKWGYPEGCLVPDRFDLGATTPSARETR